MFDIIKEYLVALGVKIDQPGFNQFDATLKKTDQKIAASSASWAKDFKKAGIAIAASIGSIVTATGGLLKNIAKTDMEMEKYSRSMMLGKKAATEMRFALDAMNESVENVRMIPELREQFKALLSDSRRMAPPADMQKQLKDMRAIIFEFTRMKQEAAYALNWIGYYIMKNFSGPLKDIKKGLKSFNDRIIHDMPRWTAKVASFVTSVINIGLSVFRLIKDIGKGLKDVWDTFSVGVKAAIASLSLLFAFINMSPIGRFMTLISGLLLLLEDFYGYIDGKDAALGPLWQKMIDKAEEAKPYIKDFWQVFIENLESADESVKEWYKTLRESEDMKSFCSMLRELTGAFAELAETVGDITVTALKDFWDYLKDIKTPARFKKAIDENQKAISALGKGFANVTRELSKFLKKMEGNPHVKSFWEAVKKVLGDCFNKILDNISAVGLFGQAIGELWQGHFKEAARLAKEAFKTGMWGSDDEDLEEYESADDPKSNRTEKLGKLSAKYESGGNIGSVSSGKGDPGGISYGKYQITTANIPSFLKFLKNDYILLYKQLQNAGKPGSKNFEKAWKRVAKEAPASFEKAQYEYIKKTHYDPIVAQLNKMGLNLDKRSNALKQVVWSMAVQVRGYTPEIFAKALNGRRPGTVTDAELIPLLYKYRKNYFSGSSDSVRKSVFKRFENECLEALKLLKKEKSDNIAKQPLPSKQMAELPKLQNEDKNSLIDQIAQVFTPNDLSLVQKVLQGGAGLYTGTAQTASAGTNNISFGDINITVTVDQPAATSQEIAGAVKTEFKSEMSNLALFRNLTGVIS